MRTSLHCPSPDLPPAPPLPLTQRAKSARQAVKEAKSLAAASKLTAAATTGSAKRPLPFTSPDEGGRGKNSKSSSATASDTEKVVHMDEDSDASNHSTTKSSTVKKRQYIKKKTPASKAGHPEGVWVPREEFEALWERVELINSNLTAAMNKHEGALEGLHSAAIEHNRTMESHEGQFLALRQATDSLEDSHTSLAGECAIMHNTVRAMQVQNSSLGSWRTSMEASINTMQKKLNNQLTISKESANEEPEDTASSFFIGGIPTLREWYQDSQADPAEILNWILREISMYCAMERMQIADNDAKGNRMAARAMIVVMRSPSKKKEAIIRLKRWLAHEGITRGVTVMDCFPSSTRDTAKAIGRYCTEMRREGKILQYRILNRDGVPVLQVKDKDGAYRDEEVPEGQLSAHKEATASTTATGQQPMETEEDLATPHAAATASAPAMASGSNTVTVGQKQQQQQQQQKQNNKRQQQPPPHLPLPTPTNNRATSAQQQHQHVGGAYRKQPVVAQPGSSRGGPRRQQPLNYQRPTNNHQQQFNNNQQQQSRQQQPQYYQPQQMVYSVNQQYPFVVQQPQPLMQHQPLMMREQQVHHEQQYYSQQQMYPGSGRNSGRNSVERR